MRLPAPEVPHTPWNFLALPPDRADPATARTVVVPVPYDGTASFRAGARDGPRAVLEASRELEDYDLEVGCEASAGGIATLPEVEPALGDPQETLRRVARTVAPLAREGRLVVLLGGEHSLTLGAVEGLRQVHPSLSVLYLDAHADLRPQHLGSPYSHACTARRLWEQGVRLVLVGVRSASREEVEWAEREGVPLFPWDPTLEGEALASAVLARLGDPVYISLDLDVLDPSLMPAVGNPVPGGMGWSELLALLRAVTRARRVVGFDLTEFCPAEGPRACASLVATLAYRLIGYITCPGGKGG